MHPANESRWHMATKTRFWCLSNEHPRVYGTCAADVRASRHLTWINYGGQIPGCRRRARSRKARYDCWQEERRDNSSYICFLIDKYIEYEDNRIDLVGSIVLGETVIVNCSVTLETASGRVVFPWARERANAMLENVQSGIDHCWKWQPTFT